MNTVHILACIAAVFVADVHAQSSAYLSIGETRTIQSRVMGENRQVIVVLPETYERTAVKYPVLFILDGSSNVLHATSTARYLARARNRVPEMIIIAVPNTNRNRDLTPGPGAAKFETFFADELIPWVETNFRAASDRVVMGHSLAGSFVVHALLNRPGLFDYYIAASAPLWRYDSLARDEARGMKRAASAGLYLAVGSLEWETLVNGMNAFVERLRARDSSAAPKWSYVVLADDDHSSTSAKTLYQGLDARYAAWRFPYFEDTLELNRVGGLKGIEAHYARFSTQFGYRSPPPESRLLQIGEMYIAGQRYDDVRSLSLEYLDDYPRLSEELVNRMGYDQLRRGQAANAVETFTSNVERFPASPNVHDSLGDAYCQAADTASARRSFERAAKAGQARSSPRVPAYERKAAKPCQPER